jgi:enoyl-CoA hydratase
MADILFERSEDGIATLTLNRPELLNAFSFGMYEELIARLESLRHDAKTRVLIVTGAGRGFCAGHDLRSPGPAPWVDPGLGMPYMAKHSITRIAQIPLLMRSIPQPVIAAVNGAAAGIGFAFALAADLCVAAQSAKFVNSIHNAGTGHELGMSWMLPRAVGTQRAAEILLTARPVLGRRGRAHRPRAARGSGREPAGRSARACTLDLRNVPLACGSPSNHCG